MNMKHHLISSIHGQRGFTMLELVVAMGITSIIMGAATTVLYQIITVNSRTTARMTAVQQVQNVTHFMVRDFEMALPSSIQVNPSPGPGIKLTLEWVDWNTNHNHVVQYSMDNTGNLVRQYDSGSQVTVAHYIASLNTSIDSTSGEYIVTITSTIEGSSAEQREIRIKPRSSS
jgi:prepilin-type N-terminal cleavage/methylation domain-containing protein